MQVIEHGRRAATYREKDGAAAMCPSEIEIRPLYEMEDFGDIVTPEVIEQEKRLREATEKLAKKS